MCVIEGMYVCTVCAKDRMQAQLALLRSELDRKEAERSAEVEALERKFLEDKSRVLKSHAESFQEIRRRAREDAQKQLDSDTKRIILDNKRMVCIRALPVCVVYAPCVCMHPACVHAFCVCVCALFVNAPCVCVCTLCVCKLSVCVRMRPVCK